MLDKFAIRDRDRALLQLRFDRLPSAHPYLLMLPQNVTEAVLADRISELGGTVHRGVTAKAMVQDARIGARDCRRQWFAKALFRRAMSSGQTACTAWCACHRHRLRRRLHMRAPSSWPMSISTGRSVDEVSLFFSPAGLVVVAPLPDGSSRVVATMDEAPEQPTAADIQALIDSRGPTEQRRQGARRRLELALSFAPPHRQFIPPGAAAAHGRCRTRAQPGRRPRHEHRTCRCRGSGSGPADVVKGERSGSRAGPLRDAAPSSCVASAGAGRAHDRHGDHAQPAEALRYETPSCPWSTSTRCKASHRHGPVGPQPRRPGTAAGLGVRPQAKYCPPLAVIVEPVIKPASSEARNTTQRAISSGSPSRPIGICGRIFSFSTFSSIALTISVAI